MVACPVGKGWPGAMTRRQVLLWGVPAVIGLAVVAIFVVLMLIPPSEASRARKKIDMGMTFEQVRDAIGKDNGGSRTFVTFGTTEFQATTSGLKLVLCCWSYA